MSRRNNENQVLEQLCKHRAVAVDARPGIAETDMLIKGNRVGVPCINDKVYATGAPRGGIRAACRVESTEAPARRARRSAMGVSPGSLQPSWPASTTTRS